MAFNGKLKLSCIQRTAFATVVLASVFVFNCGASCAFAAAETQPAAGAKASAAPINNAQQNVSQASATADNAAQQSVTKNDQSQSTAKTEAVSGNVLKGTVSQEGKRSPLLYGSVQSIPKGTPIDITFCGNVNSEVSQKGDEVFVQVARDVAGSSGVGVPGGWYMHGLVTDSSGQKRLGRDGYVEIEFDSLVSPDRAYELPFHATVSTKDKLLKSIAKVAAIDSFLVSKGAAGGAILSVQFTGIPVAIASHGYSVAIGAGVGAAAGVIGSAKRKGKIASIYPGDVMKMVTAEPISLPGFDKAMLPSGEHHEPLKNMGITINKTEFSKAPSGDRRSSLLTVDLTMNNKTPRTFSFMDLAVVSDLNQRYQPSIYGGFQQLRKSVKPHSEQEGVVTFEVDSKKRKFWLVLVDRAKDSELTRVPLN